MYKELEFFYDSFRKYISFIFESLTFRTSPEYKPCNGEEPEELYFREI